MKTLTSSVLATFFFSTIAHAAPMALEAKSEGARVEFLAIGRPSMLKIKGTGSGVDGGLKVDGTKANGAFTFDLSKLTTGIDMRDTHMKEKYLETEKFKDAKLTLTEVTLPEGFSLANPPTGDLPFKGTLNLHGQEKPVAGTVKLAKGSSPEAVSAKARFDIKITDYAIDLPSYMGIKVAENVNVDVSIPELRAKK